MTSAVFSGFMILIALLAILPRRGRGIHRLVSASQPPSAVVERRRLLSFGSSELARSAGRRLGLVAGVIAVSLCVAASLGPQVLVSLLAVAVIAAVVLAQRARHHRDRAEASRRAQIIEACDVLAADLNAGRPPSEALAGAATICADLQIASAAANLGGDVPAALELAAESPGCEGLRALAAAWRVAEESGAAFAAITERLADSLRSDETIRRQITAGLAGTRATARLLAALPLFGTALGFALGAHPLTFLTATPPGYLCLALGLALTTIGLFWTNRLAAPPTT
jgi:tight adherence protein B